MNAHRSPAVPGVNRAPGMAPGCHAQPAAGACHGATATFSGGCFWCLQAPFDSLHGVIATTLGYTGGRKRSPTHAEVVAGRTGHAVAVQILYNPACLSYGQLLEVFWRNIDPTTPNRQFCARGAQYRPAIFYHTETQQRLAEASKQAVASSQRFVGRIATRITPASEFYRAAAERQYCYYKQPLRFAYYRSACKREQRLQALWGDTPMGCGLGQYCSQ